MKRNPITVFIMLLAIMISTAVYSQIIDSTTFSMNSRLSFYSFEKNGEFLLHVPPVLSQKNLSINIMVGEKTIAIWNGKPGRNILKLPFLLNMAPSVYNIETRIIVTASPGIIYKATTTLVVLSYKPNEVKTDRLTGGLIVNRRLFFPFGFYCYSPVYSTLPEEEVVKGFNMISPYQKIISETLPERKVYMDRCAQLGMKVHYNLLSLCGGGGVSSKIEGISEEKKREILINEIKTFRDHPALLAWYISDEPTGNGITPEKLEEIYNIVKENDPWHPVSIVFMAPFQSSKEYSDALDIVMADPYPVPDSPVSMVGDVAALLKREFAGKKPLWIVPQAFGGAEWWSREPSIQEIRSMTWQSIIRGASGIQYFIRHGLNSFPKSTSTWGECGRMALEIAELTPWLLSDEETLPVESSSKDILVSTKLHDGQLIVMAVNKINKPLKACIRISGIKNVQAKVIFENRSIPVFDGLITDQIAAYGSQVYRIDITPENEIITQSPDNLIKDPGFEDVTSPGIPATCYARTGNDRGATFFLDSREHLEGNHSVRIITPTDNNSVILRFFPFSVSAGSSYVISVWAKADPEQKQIMKRTYWDNLLGRKKSLLQVVDIALGEFGKAQFIPQSEWKQFVTFVTIPQDTLASFKTNLILSMPGSGVAWFDLLQVIEDPAKDKIKDKSLK